jgi:hypothetical protein
MPNEQQIGLWFEQVSFIPSGSSAAIEDHIYKNYDALPRNLPKAVRESYAAQPQSSRIIKYDTVEDFRFPVSYLQRGLDLILNNGDSAFNEFAYTTKMPKNDINRVRFKADIIKKCEEDKYSLRKLTAKL